MQHVFLLLIRKKKKGKRKKKLFSHMYVSFPSLSAVRKAPPGHREEAFTEGHKQDSTSLNKGMEKSEDLHRAAVTNSVKS